MTDLPTQLVSDDQERQERTGVDEWVKGLAIAALVVFLLLVVAHSMIANRRYGAGRR